MRGPASRRRTCGACRFSRSALGKRSRVPRRRITAAAAKLMALPAMSVRGARKASSRPLRAKPPTCAPWDTSRIRLRPGTKAAPGTASRRVAARPPWKTGLITPSAKARSSSPAIGMPGTTMPKVTSMDARLQPTSSRLVGARSTTADSRVPAIRYGRKEVAKVSEDSSAEPVRA